MSNTGYDIYGNWIGFGTGNQPGSGSTGTTQPGVGNTGTQAGTATNSGNEIKYSNGQKTFRPHDDTTYQWQALIHKIGLQELNERGFVNVSDAESYPEDFGYAGHRNLNFARARGGGFGRITNVPDEVKREDRIHPIFYKRRWHPDTWTNGVEYEKLMPTFQLATLMLEELSMAGWLLGMLDWANHKRVKYELAQVKLAQSSGGLYEYQYFKPVQANAVIDHVKLFLHMWKLIDRTTWVLDGLVPETTATTDSDYVDYDMFNQKITITMKDELFLALCGIISPSAMSESWQPGTDDASARLRTQVYTATVLVHEIMHALWKNETLGTKPEPFYVDTRIAEVGMEWTHAMYGGILDPTTWRACCPYGLSTYRWPKEHSGEYLDRIALMSQKKWGRQSKPWNSVYAVHMSFCQQLFTHEFWDNVDRYGNSNFKIARLLGARWQCNDQFWQDESPTVMPKTYFEEDGVSVWSHDDSEEEGGITGIVDRLEPVRHSSTKYKVLAGLEEYFRDNPDMLALAEPAGPMDWDAMDMS